jgi:hypothetical protein
MFLLVFCGKAENLLPETAADGGSKKLDQCKIVSEYLKISPLFSA